jgi:hypothetical protein
MRRHLPSTIGLVAIIVGALAIVAGAVTYVIVRNTLVDQHIEVSDDAPFLAGHDVKGPFTAYAQAIALEHHAKNIGGGKTYAELAQDDPNRQTVMTADFLQASLYTSVVAFGVAFLVIGLGVMFVLFGLGFRDMDHRLHAEEALVDARASSLAPAT